MSCVSSFGTLDDAYDGRTRGDCLVCLQPMTRREVAAKGTAVLPCRHRFHGACIDNWTSERADDPACPSCRSAYEPPDDGDDPYEIVGAIRQAFKELELPPHSEEEVELLALDRVLENNRQTALRVTLRRGAGRAVQAVFRIVLVNRQQMATFWRGAGERAVDVLPRNWAATGAACTAAVAALLEAARVFE
jgi:hypothetical protein